MIETERLLLRKMDESDYEGLYELFSSEDVCRYMTNNTFNKEQAMSLLDRIIQLYDRLDTERFSIILKEDNSFVGYIDINCFISFNPAVGYAILKRCWGRGYMQEALNAFTSYLFNLGYQKVFIEIVKENGASLRVADKCGFTFLKEEREILSKVKPYEVDIVTLYKNNPKYEMLIEMEKITPQNIEVAHQIEHKIFPLYDAYNNYLDSFKEGSKNEYWILKVGNEMIGVSGIYSYKAFPEDAWLAFFGLLEEWRNKHLGGQALTLFELVAKQRGFINVRLFTDRYDNDESKNFYLRHGYQEEYYELDSDPDSKIYSLSIFSKCLKAGEELIPWDNRDIHFTKQVKKQQ